MRREWSTSRSAVAAALITLSVASCQRNPGPQVGEPAPDFALADLDGVSHALSDAKGRVVVLNFWATWCPPCVDEMPSLQTLHEALDDKGLQVMAVSVDERYSDIHEFVDEYDLTFMILHDEGKKVSRKYQSFRFPETYIIGRDGTLKSKVVGPRDWAAPSVIRDMVELLGDGSESVTRNQTPPAPVHAPAEN